MNTKYRMLEVGEMLIEGDEVHLGYGWRTIHPDSSGAKVRSDGDAYPVGYYRRRVIETNIHGSSPRSSENSTGKVVTDTVSATSSDENIDEVREAWQKDHMEMKRKLDAMTQSWYDQRNELADAKNKITDLQRKLEDSRTERDELLAWKNSAMVEDKETQAVDQFVRNHPEAIVGDSVWFITLKWLKERDELKRSLNFCQASNLSMFKQIEDKNATIRRLKENLESVEPFVPTVDGWKRLMAAIPPDNGISVAEGAVRYIQKLEQDLSGVDNHSKELQNSTDHYYQLLVKIGYMFGLRASITDDGLICETVIPEKVPELVAQLVIDHEKTL